MNYAYKFRLYPNAVQADKINRTLGCCRYVYNHYLAQRQEVYRSTGKSLSCYSQQKDLTVLKKCPETSWLGEVDSTALQASIQDLNEAFQKFFQRVKQGKKPGYPRFKKKHASRQSYRTKQNKNTIEVFPSAVKLPTLGKVKCRISRPVEGRIINATVSKTPSGKYFVSLCCELEEDIPKLQPTGAVVGLDMGIKTFAVSSDGTEYQNHKYLSQSEKKLAKLQRSLSRKTKGSANWEKARIRVARLHEHIANQRRDMQQKLSTQLIRQYDVICVEDLGVKNMVRNHKLAKAISDASWGEFLRQLTYKAEWYGRTVQKVDRFYASSQICSVCGAQWSGTKELSVRQWTCSVCGAVHDRDKNAATNILISGLRILAA